MKTLTIALMLLLLGLQYPLWFGDAGYMSLKRLMKVVDEQQARNDQLKARNAILTAEVVDLKEGLEAVEERARVELGMIKKGEIFYHIVEVPKK